MKIWKVSPGRYGEREQIDLVDGCVTVGWKDLGDIGGIEGADAMKEHLRGAYPEASDKRIINFAGQLRAFISGIAEGDIVVVPLKSSPTLAFGIVTGPYEFKPENPAGARHTRPVKWERTDVARSAVGQDLLFSLGAFSSVCGIKRNGAEQRLAAVMETGKDPGAINAVEPGLPDSPPTDIGPDFVPVDIEQLARDRIRLIIGEKFTGHGLTRLIDAVLEAQGMDTVRSPPGADGGIDVLARAGSLGLQSQKICVQVKSGDASVDVKVLRELEGVLARVHADQGLLVAWAGLTQPAAAEARSQFFKVRVWTADDVIREVTDVYDLLPDEIQAELRLKRIWTAVPESED